LKSIEPFELNKINGFKDLVKFIVSKFDLRLPKILSFPSD